MVKKLDARNNKIKTISNHIKAMMQLTILRLDHNDLTSLPNEVGEIQLLEELSFSDNKLTSLPLTIGSLNNLRMLNMSDNSIKHIPQEIGNLKQLKNLFIHGNRFTSFPCSFLNLTNLQEFSLEWFLYAKPPRPKIVKRNMNDGKEVFESLIVLCNLLQKYKMNECALITFLENYSENVFDINNVDNRLRTPLHNAAVKGDNGVLEGLLLGKADTDILDKDNCTPLCLAIREENFEAASILINSNVDVNLGGGIFGSPMHLAVVKLEIWIVRALIMKEADVNKADCDGNTPLHLVMNVFSKNPQKCTYISEILVMNGAKVNMKNNDNWAPLHIAARKGQEKGVQTIIKLNQMLKEKGLEPFDLNTTGGVQQWTALHLAAHGGHMQIIKDLIHAGADVFQRNTNNQLPRHCAKGNYILTKFLKLAEQHRIKSNMSTYHINHHHELLQNVTQKPQQEKQSKKPKVSDNMLATYDSFSTNLAHVRLSKMFSQIDFVKNTQNKHHVKSLTPNNHSNSNFVFDLQTPLSPNEHSSKIEKDSNFRKLNMKAEEKKINLFYLKDILIKDSNDPQERMDALFKIKRNINKPVFALAMKTLLAEFDKVSDKFVQKEIIYTIGCSSHQMLLQPLKDLLQSNKLEDEDIIEEAEEAVAALQLIVSKPQSYAKHINNRNNFPENGRNVNSIKMKGMESLSMVQKHNSGIRSVVESYNQSPSSNSSSLGSENSSTHSKQKDIRQPNQHVWKVLASSDNNFQVVKPAQDNTHQMTIPPKIAKMSSFMQPKSTIQLSISKAPTFKQVHKDLKKPNIFSTDDLNEAIREADQQLLSHYMNKTQTLKTQGHRSSWSIPSKK